MTVKDYISPLESKELQELRKKNRRNRGNVLYAYTALKEGFKDCNELTTNEVQLIYIDLCKNDGKIPVGAVQFWNYMKFMLKHNMLKREFVTGKVPGRYALFNKGKKFDEEELLEPLETKKVVLVRNYLEKHRRCFGDFEMDKRFCREVCGIRERCEAKSNK